MMAGNDDEHERLVPMEDQLRHSTVARTEYQRNE